jgi:hypothetical protein
MSFKTTRTLDEHVALMARGHAQRDRAERLREERRQYFERGRMSVEDYDINRHIRAQRMMNRSRLFSFGYNPQQVDAITRAGQDFATVRRLSIRNAQLSTLRRPPYMFRFYDRDGRMTSGEENWRRDRGAHVITRFLRRVGASGRKRSRT